MKKKKSRVNTNKIQAIISVVSRNENIKITTQYIFISETSPQNKKTPFKEAGEREKLGNISYFWEISLAGFSIISLSVLF